MNDPLRLPGSDAAGSAAAAAATSPSLGGPLSDARLCCRSEAKYKSGYARSLLGSAAAAVAAAAAVVVDGGADVRRAGDDGGCRARVGDACSVSDPRGDDVGDGGLRPARGSGTPPHGAIRS